MIQVVEEKELPRKKGKERVVGEGAGWDEAGKCGGLLPPPLTGIGAAIKGKSWSGVGTLFFLASATSVSLTTTMFPDDVRDWIQL